ncbi:unnamed protein product [Menidia menidia]|uniref:(Atlantic silverside) hypothetical protein n=1 Tax=Menidia menidia TaxID=238744 RepID=A0A8S4C227_9TELE|nr:unnamed protein product [Menidia menidia]
MDLRSELLKSIWYGFTALDLEKSGKVSKSQLKVLSHNLCTVLSIPHDPVALEEHFRDDDDGPVSSQGYMPYLNKYILDKVVEGSFNKENVDELCWTLTAKKNYQPDRSSSSILPEKDAFRLWCLFNFLSEDKYPLVMVPDEVEYLLKKICMAMSIEFNCVELEDFFSQDSVQHSGITVWIFLEMMNSGKVTRGIDKSIISMAIEEVYREIVGDVLKEGYLWKKGQLRRNWKERWFTLRPSNLSYYTGEDRKDCQGNIVLDGNCCVEECKPQSAEVEQKVLPDRDGKRCMFCLKTLSKTYEMSASDTKQRQEWTTAIQTAIRLHVEGKKSLHKDLKLKRREQREQREKRQQAKEEELQRLRALQEERERNLAELELLKEAQKQAQALMELDEQRRRQQHEQLQRALEVQLREAEEVSETAKKGEAKQRKKEEPLRILLHLPLCFQARVSMQAEMALKEEEAERQRKRIQELEEMQKRLEEALQQEIKARLDEEAFRYAQAGLLAEEEEKMKALMSLQEEQEEYIITTQREKQELKQEMEAKSRALEEAQRQLEEVRANRHRVDQDVVAAQRKLRQASTNVKHWNVQMNRLMRPIGPGEKRPSLGGSHSTFQIPTQRDPGLRLWGRSGSEDQDEESKENVNKRAGSDLEKRRSNASNGDMDIP